MTFHTKWLILKSLALQPLLCTHYFVLKCLICNIPHIVSELYYPVLLLMEKPLLTQLCLESIRNLKHYGCGKFYRRIIKTRNNKMNCKEIDINVRGRNVSDRIKEWRIIKQNPKVSPSLPLVNFNSTLEFLAKFDCAVLNGYLPHLELIIRNPQSLDSQAQSLCMGYSQDKGSTSRLVAQTGHKSRN